MGGLPGLVGFGGGAGGTSFAGPQAANITNPTNSAQIDQAYSGNQGALGNQQALLQALQAQNGLQNQNQVYGQLQGVASGAVNPAQAQFAQNTSQNVANQAALMAGQRGASSNVGLMARQAAQQGAGIQQQAVGQQAAQQAQNQINAIGQAGQLATTQAGQQIGQTNANTSAQQAEQANLLNAMQGYNSNQVASQASINSANAGLANTQLMGQQKMIGGALNGVSALAAGANGGEVAMADGGDPSLGVNTTLPAAPMMSYSGMVMSPNPQPTPGPSSVFGKFLKGAVSGGQPSAQPGAQVPSMASADPLESGVSNLIGALGKKSPTEINTTMPDGSVAGPSNNFGAPQLQMPTLGAPQAQGGMIKDFRTGGKVNASAPKEKAVSSGNDYANDKIPAVLSEHEIVLPRSVTLSQDPIGESAKFVAKVIAKRKGMK